MWCVRWWWMRSEGDIKGNDEEGNGEKGKEEG